MMGARSPSGAQMALHTKFNLFCLLVLTCLLPLSAAAESIPLTSAMVSDHEDPGEVYLFRPEEGSIHSAAINDLANGPHGETLFATNFGLSIYDGNWNTWHINRDDYTKGLMDDYVTAIEYDNAGNLWIGFGGGIQVYDGHIFTVIRDQELLKSLRIKDFQRWDEGMWVATGNAGLHSYYNGEWYWYTPYSRNGPQFYEADSLALDTATDSLLVGTEKEGLWKVTLDDKGVQFFQLQTPLDSFGQLGHVRRDPLGGGFFFNATRVAHYDNEGGFVTILKVSDLVGGGSYAINDVAGTSDGIVYVATDNGIYVWEDNRITNHLSVFEGIGTIHGVDRVFYDVRGRLWFSTQEDVGYFTGNKLNEPKIPVETVTPTPTLTTVTITANISQTQTPVEIPTVSSPSVLDKITAFFSGLFPFFPSPH